jgi:hypothetical protein
MQNELDLRKRLKGITRSPRSLGVTHKLVPNSRQGCNPNCKHMQSFGFFFYVPFGKFKFSVDGKLFSNMAKYKCFLKILNCQIF